MTTTTTTPAGSPGAPTRMPALYLSHGAPPLADDPVWPGQLAAWSAALPLGGCRVHVSDTAGPA